MMYKQSHIITPEYYPIMPPKSNPNINHVKALFLSHYSYVPPQIITDDPQTILSVIFKDIKPIPIFFKKDYHIYLNPIDQVIGDKVNFVATFLARINSLHSFNQASGEQVCGNVIIFGSRNLKTKNLDNKNHSVPYDLVEECLRIYDIR